MKILRPASYEEFVNWYLRREYLKRGKRPLDFGSIESQMELMSNEHSGKIRDWFQDAIWNIVELDQFSDVENLVCLASDWTRRAQLLLDEDQLDNRLLKTFVVNAFKNNYFGSESRAIQHLENLEKRQFYMNHLKENPQFQFRDDNRIVLCSLSRHERETNPSGTYYLHDGLGRMLPFGYLVSAQRMSFRPVEAFEARQPS